VKHETANMLLVCYYYNICRSPNTGIHKQNTIKTKQGQIKIKTFKKLKLLLHTVYLAPNV